MIGFHFVEASSHLEATQTLIDKVEGVILFPIMSFMLSLALLLFLWGAFEFVSKSESDEGRETGKRHMIWGIIGMLIMISALSILRIFTNTFGCDIDAPGGCGSL